MTIEKRDIIRSLKKPLPFGELAAVLGLRKHEGKQLKKLLRPMVEAGEIIRNRKGYYGLPDEMALVTGYFEAHRDGFGFVVPERPGERDVFVPARMSMAAMDGDRVVARLESAAKRQGSIVRVLHRAHKRIAGIVMKAGGTLFVRPRDRAMSFDVVVAPPKGIKADEGDMVSVEIEEYPSDGRPAIGRILKKITSPEDPRSEVESIIEEYGLPGPFPPSVRAEAKALALKPEPGNKRRDLTELPTVTIDGERARDFDDAISIDLSPHGYTLWVHIADVGHYVPWGSPTDMEARQRGTSVYFPDRVIPMLPKELSEDLCSLKPKVMRAAFTVRMEFDRTGAKTGAEFFPSLIVSDERMTYTSVRKILVDQDPKERKRYAALLREFELMDELAGLIRQRRIARGSLDFDLPEPEVILDMQGRPEAIIKAERNLAHMIIEEFMISANEAVAEHLTMLGLPTLYRIHEPPDAGKVEEALRVLRPSAATNRRVDASALRVALKQTEGTPFAEAASYIVLRTLKQARYSTENAGHFGLASECYLHFTSPIRRYPDLVVHRVLREALEKRKLSDDRKEALLGLLREIALQSSRSERVAEKAEREVIGAMRVWFMAGRVGESFDGAVVGVSTQGIRVRLNECYVDGFLHVSSLSDDYYAYDERSVILRGRRGGRTFGLGQAVRIRLERVDRAERELVFGLVDEVKKKPAGAAPVVKRPTDVAKKKSAAGRFRRSASRK